MKITVIRAFVFVALLVAGTTVGTRPATALVSTGSVTVDGWYYYSSSTTGTTWNCYPGYTCTYYSSTYGYSFSSGTCADNWIGTTTAGSNAGISCALYLSGSVSYIHDYTPTNLSTYYNPSPLKLDGSYLSSDGRYHQLHFGTLPQTLTTATLTGTVTSSDSYTGPATATFNTVPLYSSSCSPYCGGDYWYYESGSVTLTLDYAIH